ncbi:MAG: sulfurtransferase [Cypionkella sp.]
MATLSIPLSGLVSPSWLSDNLTSEDLVILDANVPYGPSGPDENLGLESWQHERIPGARFARLQSRLSDVSTGLGFSRPSPQALVDELTRLGIGRNSTVVIYDTLLNMWATRIWWLLRGLGFERAAVLDGGLSAWKTAGLPLESGFAAPVIPSETPIEPRLLAGFGDVDAVDGISSDDALVCALPESYFNGAEAVNGRRGHIPGSLNIPAASLLDEAGCFLPVEFLRQKLVQVTDKPSIVLYCGGGISATVVAFALHLVGAADKVTVFDGSLEEWNADPARPLVGTL